MGRVYEGGLRSFAFTKIENEREKTSIIFKAA
jgi:hypothetical protein